MFVKLEVENLSREINRCLTKKVTLNYVSIE